MKQKPDYIRGKARKVWCAYRHDGKRRQKTETIALPITENGWIQLGLIAGILEARLAEQGLEGAYVINWTILEPGR